MVGSAGGAGDARRRLNGVVGGEEQISKKLGQHGVGRQVLIMAKLRTLETVE